MTPYTSLGRFDNTLVEAKSPAPVLVDFGEIETHIVKIWNQDEGSTTILKTIALIDGLLSKIPFPYKTLAGRRLLVHRSLLKLKDQPGLFDQEKKLLQVYWRSFPQSNWAPRSGSLLAAIWFRVAELSQTPEVILNGMESFFTSSSAKPIYLEKLIKIKNRQKKYRESLKYVDQLEEASLYGLERARLQEITLAKCRTYNANRMYTEARRRCLSSIRDGLCNTDILKEGLDGCLSSKKIEYAEKIISKYLSTELEPSERKSVFRLQASFFLNYWTRVDDKTREILHEKFFTFLKDGKLSDLPIEEKKVWLHLAMENFKFLYKKVPYDILIDFCDMVNSSLMETLQVYIFKVKVLVENGKIFEAYFLTEEIKMKFSLVSEWDQRYIAHVENLWYKQVKMIDEIPISMEVSSQNENKKVVEAETEEDSSTFETFVTNVFDLNAPIWN